MKRFGTDSLLWYTSNRCHCAVWWNEESPDIYARECQHYDEMAFLLELLQHSRWNRERSSKYCEDRGAF